METSERKNLGDEIVKTIQRGEVKMRSRRYFVLRDILGAIAIVIVMLIVVYLASFIVFVLHQEGAWFVPIFGFAGWYSLFNALPWVLISLSALFIIVLAVLTKRYAFGYQWPLLYSILGIIFLIAGVCFLFIRTSFYDELFNSAVSRDIPFLNYYYPGIGFLAPNDIHRGEILKISAGSFTMRDASSRIFTVIIGPKTSLFLVASSTKAGDLVVVFGGASPTGTIAAVGIEKLAE